MSFIAAPVAPRKDQVIRVVNESSILIFPSSWDHPIGCPITKLTIEYRASSQHTWTLVSSQAPSDEVIELSNLVSKSLYSVRMTAHTKGSPSTMAEYEARVGMPEELFSASHSKGLLFSIDSSTLISLTSSLFVLLVGFVAVTSLVLYKRKLNKGLMSKKHYHSHHQLHHHHLRKPSATSAASTVHTEVSSGILVSDQQQPHRTPTSIPVSRLNREKQAQALPAIPISEEKANMISGKTSSLFPASLREQSNTNSSNGSKKSSQSTFNCSPPVLLRGRLPKVLIPRKELDDIDKDLYSEYDEITPYATFTLLDDRTSKKVEDPEEDFKTFTVSIGEPAYNFKVSPETRC